MSEFEIPKKFKNPKKSSPIKMILIMVLAFFLASIVILKVYLASLPPIANLETFKPNIVTKIYSSDDEIIKTFTAYRFEKVGINEVPENLKNAVIATEDKNFYHHQGYDMFGLIRSTFVNLKAGKVVQGASTITQQLARILFLSNEKTFDRKIKEIIISARIEKTISKDQILEMYLNNVYLGSGAYGVAGASTIYFNKPIKSLTLAECALIAGLPQAPSVYSPYNNMELAKERRSQVLNRMYKMRYITKQEYEQAEAEPVNLNPNPSIYTLNRAPYFVDYVMEELDSLGFDETEISQGGYKVVTTLNYKAQEAADNAIKKNLAAWNLTKDQQQAAVFSFSPITGQILTYIGGKNYERSQYDRVTQAVRPPGSSFKPFVYAAAVEKGWLPTDIIEDTPVRFADWAPRNYGGKYRGRIPLYKALMYSSNVCAVKLIKDVGIRAVINTARALGITTPIEYDYTIALGSNAVKLYEMTIAYGAFANGGFKVKPYSVERVETSRGKVVYQAPKTRIIKVLDINTASCLTAMLKQVIIGGTGRAANIGKPAAGKTGTTDNYKDAWFLGYTPDIVTGVWVGNDDNSKMSNLTGGTVPALIWKDMMKVATEKYPNSEFGYPEIKLQPEILPAKDVTETNENTQTAPQEPQEDSNQQQEDNTMRAPVPTRRTDETKPSFSGTFSDIPTQTPRQPSNEPRQAPVPNQGRFY